jgi:hypothetical protein
MTSHHPSLFLKRLQIASKRELAYDQVFHLGVNIIRGDNAHGKSTIADFIFYALGGDQNVWKEQALACDTVTAELQINGVDIVIRRFVSEDSRQPLQIFWGSLNDAPDIGTIGWEMYPYSRSANKESFSQKFFQILDLPQMRGMEGDSITLHQLLRLIYVDQISPYDSLLRTEPFDSSLKREAIGDLMLGLYDRSIHDDQLELQQKTRDLESARSEIRALEHVLRELDIKTDSKEFEKARAKTEEALLRINSDIDELTKPDSTVTPLVAADELTQKRLVELRKAHSAALEKLQSAKFEIEDSKLFIKDIDVKLIALQDSISARRGLGTISLEYCPVCLTPIEDHKSGNRCGLCKSDVNSSAVDARAIRMMSELEMQKRESSELLDIKIVESKKLVREIASFESAIMQLQGERDRALETVRTSRDSKLDLLFQDRGVMTEKLRNLNQGLRSAAILRDFENRAKEIQQRINHLNYAIFENKKKQATKQNTVNALISQIALSILKVDNVEEEHILN